MKALDAYSKFLDGLTKVLKAILIILLSAMVLIMAYQVIMRYIFQDAKPWCEELTLYISIFSIMLALGIASRSDSHLQVDFLTRLYGPRLRCLMAGIWSVVAIVIMVLFAYYSIRLMEHATARSVSLPITMAEVYTAFPIGAAILILYSLEIAIRNFIGFANNGELPALPKDRNRGEQA